MATIPVPSPTRHCERSEAIQQEAKTLLFSEEKRSKKDFTRLHACRSPGTRASGQKFFGSFFQKRTAYFFFLSA
jgi:hypothetical protein